MWSDDQANEEPPGWKARLGRFVFGAVLIGGLGTAIYFIVGDVGKPERHTVQTVTRLTLPPPPPPPPPPPKPPEPPKVVETPKLQEPKVVQKQPDKAPPKPQQPPQSPLTAEAGNGPSAYGLGVGDGSGNVVGGGGGGGSYLTYGRIISSDVQAALRREEKLRYAHFTADLRLWLDATGKVTRVQLSSSSGDPVIDNELTRALSGLSMGEPPPRDMPQPVRLRTKFVPG